MINVNNIDFGMCKKGLFYRKSYTFVEKHIHESIDNPGKDIFFHISKLDEFKKTHGPSWQSCVAGVIDENANYGYFWYEFSKNEKGIFVNKILTLSELNNLKYELKKFYLNQILKTVKKDYFMRPKSVINGNQPAASGPEIFCAFLLTEQEINLIKNKFQEKKTENIAAVKSSSFINFKALFEKKTNFGNKVNLKLSENKSTEIENEYLALVEEIRSLEFTHSYQVSEYIESHNLGSKYRLLSGDLDMKTVDGRPFVYKNGINPLYYGRLCSELGLIDKRSGAKVTGFRSFDELHD